LGGAEDGAALSSLMAMESAVPALGQFQVENDCPK
jgi:hypothetical protein